MLQLRDIMSTEMVTVTPETPVREALEILGQRHVSGAPVVNGGKLEGVITSSDLMTFSGALPGVPTERQEEDDSALWGEPSIESEVEREDEPGSAFFSELWDDAGGDVVERIAEVRGPEWNALEEHTVSEAMTRAPLVTLAPSADVEAAARLMKERKIHRILVTEGDTLVGIVSAFDIAAAVADHRLTKRTYVFNRADDYDRFE